MWITWLIGIVIFPYFTTDTINIWEFCGPASYHTDYGAETIMWELHTLFLTVHKPITDTDGYTPRCEVKDSCRRLFSKPNKTNLSLVNQQERGFG